MVTRVSEFVAAMNDVSGKSGATTAKRRGAARHFQHRDRQGARRPRRARHAVQHARPFARRGGGAARTQQPQDRGRRCAAADQHRDARLDARRAHRRFRATAAALLQPARGIARCSDDAGARDRQHHRRDEQRERAHHRAAVRAGAHDLRGRAQAHRRNAQRGLRSGRRTRCTACSASPPTASPRSCKA